jgi:hypothetical protein
MRSAAVLALVLASVALGGCQSREEKLADATTRAVYDDSYDSVTDSMTPQLAKQVTRQQVGMISDLMHGHGDYKGLSETGTEPDGAFDFRADFSNGSFVVKMKMSSDDKIAGYRVIPASSQ